jgi:hypothetical protein
LFAGKLEQADKTTGKAAGKTEKGKTLFLNDLTEKVASDVTENKWRDFISVSRFTHPRSPRHPPPSPTHHLSFKSVRVLATYYPYMTVGV